MENRIKEGEKLVIVRFGELWLRGKNRGQYIKLLRKNLFAALKGEEFELEPGYDRLLLRLSKKSNLDSITKKLSFVFGISSYEVAYATKPSIASVDKLARKLLAKLPKGSVLRIDAHRSYKKLPFNSREVVSALLKTAKKMRIECSAEDYSEVLLANFTEDNAFLSFGRKRGAHGLPVGSSGKAVILISGGIDSPVAAWYAIKRGMEPVYVHVHALPKNKDVMNSKMRDIFKRLSAYAGPARVYCVPSNRFQLKAVKAGRYELILLKAFMLRLAEKIAEKEGAKAIFTGESLGQVASQTADNLAAESLGVRIPILRPLIGFDKEEIISVAKAIGTYDDSIKEYMDVCSINARNPATTTRMETMQELADDFGLDSIVSRSLDSSELALVK